MYILCKIKNKIVLFNLIYEGINTFNTELNYNDMINLETNIANAEKENNEDIERNSLMINIEGLTNYLINLKENKYKIRMSCKYKYL